MPPWGTICHSSQPCGRHCSRTNSAAVITFLKSIPSNSFPFHVFRRVDGLPRPYYNEEKAGLFPTVSSCINRTYVLLYNNVDLFATCTLKTWICTHSALPRRQKTLQFLQFLQFVFSVVIARSEALAVILSEAKDLLVKTRFFANEAQNDWSRCELQRARCDGSPSLRGAKQRDNLSLKSAGFRCGTRPTKDNLFVGRIANFNPAINNDTQSEDGPFHPKNV